MDSLSERTDHAGQERITITAMVGKAIEALILSR